MSKLIVDAKQCGRARGELASFNDPLLAEIVRALTPVSEGGEAEPYPHGTVALMKAGIREAFTDKRAIEAVAKRLDVTQNEHSRKRAAYMLLAAARALGLEVPDGEQAR